VRFELKALRQIGLGLLMYADDHDGWLPETTHGSSTNRSWIFTMASYFGGVDAIRLCPADPKAHARLTNYGSSYMMNEYTSVDRVDPFGAILETFRNLNRLKRPSETITVFTCGDRVSSSTFTDHTHSRTWPKGWNDVLNDMAPDRHRTGKGNDQHTTGSDNYLYADGHVAAIPAAVLKRRFDNGENIAKPPD
jgi:hypothetical protein